MKKRRCIIVAVAVALYAALLCVAWVIGTEEARRKTEAQLTYSIIDFRSTILGAIDTMLGYIAKSSVRYFEVAAEHSLSYMREFAQRMDIDEINIIDRNGAILASNDPLCVGRSMLDFPASSEFMILTNGVTATYSQHFRAGAHNPNVRRKYLGAAFPGGDGFVQVGFDERHLSKMLVEMLGYIFDDWLLGETGFFLCSDVNTDRMISNPARHRDEAATLAETGFDSNAAKPYEITSDDSVGETFRQTLFGRTCYCRNYVFGGHRFVPALPDQEFYGLRTQYMVVFGVLIFLTLAAFGWFVDRMMSDSDRLKESYANEAKQRAKELSIANMIQSAAMPNALPKDPRFRLFADMTAAKEVGGDFYDYFPLDDSHYAFLVADVSGKGITAALYMMTAKTLIKDTLLMLHDPAAALTKVNAELCRNNPANMFLSAWVGVLTIETGLITFANAGHNPPVIMRKGRTPEYLRTKSECMLAVLDDMTYKLRTAKLNVGDALLLYTDGVTEALDPDEALFGDDRLIDVIGAANSFAPSHICKLVRSAVAAFAAGSPQADDITVLALQYLAPPRVFSRLFRATSDGISEATAFLDEAMESVGLAMTPHAATLNIILDEITSNIVKHSGAHGFEVDITVAENPNSVTLVFSDDGTPYDPLAHVDPDTTLSAEERPIGGLGILMVKKMSNEVVYSRGHNRNILKVVKIIPAAGID